MLRDVGETRLLEELCSTGGGARLEIEPGDDAAGWRPGPGIEVISTDALVEGVDFVRTWQLPYEVGLKAYGAAASDLAAMGAEPQLVVTCLICTPDTDFSTVRAIQLGMADAARSQGAVVAGGDVSSGSGPLVLAVTAVGSVPDGEPVRISGAHPGDAVLVTGALGGAAAAVAALKKGQRPDAAWRARLVSPRPRTAEGLALRRAGASAMTDISDGLLVDAGRLAQASGVRVAIWCDALPLAPGLSRLAGAEGLELAVAGGEDFELLASVAPAGLEALLRAWEGPQPLTLVGEVQSGAGVQLLDRRDGGEIPWGGRFGFRHF